MPTLCSNSSKNQSEKNDEGQIKESSEEEKTLKTEAKQEELKTNSEIEGGEFEDFVEGGFEDVIPWKQWTKSNNW